ncbi:hypothetical protein EJD97_003557, partial [Solanum chilense]
QEGKLSPRCVGPYEILQKIGKVAYELKLHSELTLVHPVFHDLMIKKCIVDSKSILPIKGLGIQDNLSYEEVMVQILDIQVKELRNKEVSSIKVLWKIHLVEGATWEAVVDLKSHYRHLFDK